MELSSNLSNQLFPVESFGIPSSLLQNNQANAKSQKPKKNVARDRALSSMEYEEYKMKFFPESPIFKPLSAPAELPSDMQLPPSMNLDLQGDLFIIEEEAVCNMLVNRNTPLYYNNQAQYQNTLNSQTTTKLQDSNSVMSGIQIEQTFKKITSQMRAQRIFEEDEDLSQKGSQCRRRRSSSGSDEKDRSTDYIDNEEARQLSRSSSSRRFNNKNSCNNQCHQEYNVNSSILNKLNNNNNNAGERKKNTKIKQISYQVDQNIPMANTITKKKIKKEDFTAGRMRSQSSTIHDYSILSFIDRAIIRKQFQGKA